MSGRQPEIPVYRPKAQRDLSIVAEYATGDTSLEKIARQHGITRERVRQICTKAGVTRATCAKPYSKAGWQTLYPDDPRFRFGWSQQRFDIWQHHHALKPVRRAQVETLKAWKAEHDREPQLQEIYTLLNTRCTTLAALWGRNTSVRAGRSRRYYRYLARLFRLAGVRQGLPKFGKVFHPDTPGHGRPPLTHCMRGHEMSGSNVYHHKTGGGRSCRACTALWARLRYAEARVARQQEPSDTVPPLPIPQGALPMQVQHVQRNLRIATDYLAGTATSLELSKREGLSVARVNQICAAMGASSAKKQLTKASKTKRAASTRDRQGRKTHCIRGHALKAPNLYYSGKSRQCKQCVTDRNEAKKVPVSARSSSRPAKTVERGPAPTQATQQAVLRYVQVCRDMRAFAAAGKDPVSGSAQEWLALKAQEGRAFRALDAAVDQMLPEAEGPMPSLLIQP